MSTQRATLEMIAPSVEEAVELGLAQLGLPREAVDVEVLDQGNRGLFGLGARQSRVRLIVKDADAALPAEPVPAPQKTAPQKATSQMTAPQKVETTVPEASSPASEPAAEEETEAEVETGEQEPALHVARDTVRDLLDKMKVQARITARYELPEDGQGKPSIYVDVRGDDLSILIGRRAETLNALQYIAGLIVGKELNHSISLIVDVEGYRARRASQLRQLARRIADQVVKTGRRQALEPMPANERRVIHIELRDHPDVTTESIGDEPNRKVTVVLKQ